MIGTYNQQLETLNKYLAVPRQAKEELGHDFVWEQCQRWVLSGGQEQLLDQDFRNLVRRMRQAQQRIWAVDKTHEGWEVKRQAAVAEARSHEAEVDRVLLMQSLFAETKP